MAASYDSKLEEAYLPGRNREVVCGPLSVTLHTGHSDSDPAGWGPSAERENSRCHFTLKDLSAHRWLERKYTNEFKCTVFLQL